MVEKRIYFDSSVETLKSSYETLHLEIKRMFVQNWDQIREKKIIPLRQTEPGTFHYDAQFRKTIRPIIDKFGWGIPVEKLMLEFEHGNTSQ